MRMRPEIRNAKKKNFIKALRENNGIIVAASKVAGINRCTYTKWHKEDEAFREECTLILEETIDKVESKLLSLIDKLDTTAIIFYLKTKGKHRGYVERSEFTGKEGAPLFSTMTDEEMEAKVKQLMKVIDADKPD